MSSYLKIIYNFIYSHVGIKEDIKDIVQETMLAVWNNMNTYENKSSFKTWVLGISKRKIADYYRNNKKNNSCFLSDYDNCIKSEDEFKRVDITIDVRRAIDTLSETDIQLVFLVFYAQLTYSEISETLNIPVGTIKSRMSSIKAKLKKQLETEAEINHAK